MQPTTQDDARRRRRRKVSADRQSSIPRADSANAIAIYDGQAKAGTVVEHDGSHFSYGTDDILIGEFNTRLEAVRSLPRVRT